MLGYCRQAQWWWLPCPWISAGPHVQLLDVRTNPGKSQHDLDRAPIYCAWVKCIGPVSLTPCAAQRLASQAHIINRFDVLYNYWATGLFLRTPFAEGCAGANKKASLPGRHQEQAPKKRHQEQAPKQRCSLRPTIYSSVAVLAPLCSVQFRPYYRWLGLHWVLFS